MRKSNGRIIDLILIILISAITASTSMPVCGRETPPGAGLWKSLVGGVVHFKELGITCQIMVFIPPEYHPENERYFWRPGVEVPEGAIIRLMVLADTGRKDINGDDDFEIVIHRNTPPQGWKPVLNSDSSYVSCDIPTEGWPKNQPLILRAYADAGSHDVDNRDFAWLWVIPREEIFRRMGVEPPAAAGDALVPEGIPTGSIKVTLDTPGSIDRVTVKWQNPKGEWVRVESRSISSQGDAGYFDGIPCGLVTISYWSQSDEEWLLIGTESDLFQNLGEGQVVEFRLKRGGSY